MCKVLGASRSGYYRFRQHIVRDREIANVRLLHEIRIVHEESHGIYGSPRIFVELQARGISCGRHRVERLMQGAGIVAKICRRYRVTTRARKGAQYCPDRLQRRFDVERVHQVWTSDITYIWTGEGWLYLAVVLDLKSRMVVGWATGERIDALLVCRAVGAAVTRYRPSGEIIFHSDRGSQYTSQALVKFIGEQHVKFLQSHGLSCYDNAVTESFFHTLKTESVHFEHYESRLDGHRSLFHYIEVFYNRNRRHSSLGYLTPEEKMQEQLNQPKQKA
jgi:transposase InsO family protein